MTIIRQARVLGSSGQVPGSYRGATGSCRAVSLSNTGGFGAARDGPRGVTISGDRSSPVYPFRSHAAFRGAQIEKNLEIRICRCGREFGRQSARIRDRCVNEIVKRRHPNNKGVQQVRNRIQSGQEPVTSRASGNSSVRSESSPAPVRDDMGRIAGDPADPTRSRTGRQITPGPVDRRWRPSEMLQGSANQCNEPRWDFADRRTGFRPARQRRPDVKKTATLRSGARRPATNGVDLRRPDRAYVV